MTTQTPPNGAAIRALVAAYRKSHSHPGAFACCSAHDVADAAPDLLDEITRLREERDQFANRVDTLTSVAKGNKRHVTSLMGDLSAAQSRVAELEAERHQANEWLEDAAKALRAKDDRIAELEQQRDTVRGEVAEAVMCPDAECLNRHHLPKVVGLLGGVGLVDAPEAGGHSG